LRKPELVSPAGEWDCLKAAVENGADAIYFGLDRHNARMRAANFTEADLPRLVEFLHRRGVKAYLTFNTLVFENELAEAAQALRALIAAGVDAAMVQDVGICRLIRQISPDFPIHASTQMTITSASGIEFARELGCQAVVLARECSVKEIEKIRAALATAPPDACGEPGLPFPLEVFIHGALCVAYSGQCLTSEALGGRSANRGVCAQACRMPYDLLCDHQLVPLGDRRYLLSPRDLAGLELLPDLIRAGVSSLKIEGRLKTPEYVANITRIYRDAIDRVFAELTRESSSPPSEGSHAPARALAKSLRHELGYDLEMAFSRGLHTGWLGGVNNQELVHARFGKKRGVYLGEVKRIQGRQVVVRLQAPLKPGDGVVFDAGQPDQEEEGGRVYHIDRHDGDSLLGFGDRDINFRRVQAGDRLWKTSDPELDRRLRQTFAGEQPRFQRPIHFEVRGEAGQPLTLVVRDEKGRRVEVQSGVPLALATNQPLTTAKLREQLGRLGGTPFQLGDLANRLTGQVILPVSELNRLRREVVGQLEQLWAQPNRWTLETSPAAEEDSTGVAAEPAMAELVVLVRSLPQLEMALQCGVRTIYCELEDPKKYREAVRSVRLSQGGGELAGSAAARPEVFVAPPRVYKPGEEWILEQVRSCEADGYLVRGYDHLRFFAGCRCIGDYSLNVANSLAADYFRRRFKLERLTASYDLNVSQLEALLQRAPPAWFDVTVHQHMPMFHMEHCVFCAFLTEGTDYTNCGRPCDQHEVQLRDRVGAEHPVKADAGCRNTVFNALAQTGAESVARLQALGVRHFRVEFLNETPETVRQTIARYRQLLRGEMTGAQLWRELKLMNQLGVTRGQMDKGDRG
jgi:U32 family peptidase